MTLSDWRDPLDPDSEAQMIFTQLLQSRQELRQKFLGAAEEFQKDPIDINENYLRTSPDRKAEFPTKGQHTTVSDSERAMAVKLLEVIDELEKAHQTFEEKEIKRS